VVMNRMGRGIIAVLQHRGTPMKQSGQSYSVRRAVNMDDSPAGPPTLGKPHGEDAETNFPPEESKYVVLSDEVMRKTHALKPSQGR
jgi:hypothetical protein